MAAKKKTARAGARSASRKVTETKREVRKVAKEHARTSSRVEQHGDKLVEALARLAELEKKVRQMAQDPVVTVPHETKRRVDELTLRLERWEDSVAVKLAEKATQASLDRLDTRVEQLEGQVGTHGETLDNHEDRLDALEEEATEPEASAAPVKVDAKCRCAKGHEGRDPDCYVHGQSFDTTDRPSVTPPVEDDASQTFAPANSAVP